MEKNNNIIKKGNLEFFTIKLSQEYAYDPNYQFVKGKNEWVEYGADNLMPNILIKYYENSPTHQSLCFLKQNMIYGGGLEYDKNNRELKLFFENSNIKNVLKKAIKDLVIFDGFAFDIGWNEKGDYIAEIGWYDFSSIRAENSDTNKPNWYYLNSDWANYKKNEMVKIPRFNIDKSKSQPNQIIYSYESTPGTYYYPKPDYKCHKFIEFEVMLGEFVYSNMSNGMSPSGIFSFKEVPSKEERQLIKNSIKRDFTGPSSSGKFIALFAEGKDKAVEFIPIRNDNNADIYKNLNEICVQKIVSGHHLNNPAVAGLPTAGGVSFGNQLATSYEYFYNIIIKNYQDRIIDELSRVLIINGLIQDSDEIRFKTLNPYQYKFDSNIIGNSVTINEVRKDMGLPPIEGGEAILFKNGQNPTPFNTNNPNPLPPTQSLI
jgi:hypothetical protein